MSVVGHPGTTGPGTTRSGPAGRTSAPDGLDTALIGLGVLGVLGAAAQLAPKGSVHVLPWAAALLLSAAAVLLTVPRIGHPGRRVARALSLVVLASAAAAVAEHLVAGPGAGVGAFTRSWYGDIGVSLAPGLLGQSALLLLVASLGARPRLARLGRRLGRRVRAGNAR